MAAGGTTGSLSVEHIRANDMGGGIGGILYTLRSGTASFTHYNHRGDVTAKTDATGSLTYQSTYEAFGTRSAEVGSTPDREKSNTKPEDLPGYANEGFRFRDLETGVFLTRDPAGFVDGPNLYTYVVQNPWTKFDPLGLLEMVETEVEVPDPLGGTEVELSIDGSWRNVPKMVKTKMLEFREDDAPLERGFWGNTQQFWDNLGEKGFTNFMGDKPLVGLAQIAASSIGLASAPFAAIEQSTCAGLEALDNRDLLGATGHFAFAGIQSAATVGSVAGLQTVNHLRPSTLAARGGGNATGVLGRSGEPLVNAAVQPIRNQATTIGGRQFTGHALDQMQNRGFIPSVVENTIRQGTPFPTRAGTTGFYDSVNNVRVITDSASGRVVTVIPGAP